MATRMDWKSALDDADWMSRIIAISAHLVDVTSDDVDRMACELVEALGEKIEFESASRALTHAQKSSVEFATAFRAWIEHVNVSPAAANHTLIEAFDHAVSQRFFPGEMDASPGEEMKAK